MLRSAVNPRVAAALGVVLDVTGCSEDRFAMVHSALEEISTSCHSACNSRSNYPWLDWLHEMMVEAFACQSARRTRQPQCGSV
jgi:hypothetical protein